MERVLFDYHIENNSVESKKRRREAPSNIVKFCNDFLQFISYFWWLFLLILSGVSIKHFPRCSTILRCEKQYGKCYKEIMIDTYVSVW